MSFENLHVYTRPHQPATRWVDNRGPKPMVFKWPARKLIRCQSCWRLRYAENCTVQAYYDHLGIWCAPGKGCKSEAHRNAIARREFRNRSRGQRRRWEKARVAA